jgi:hypothetical protein
LVKPAPKVHRKVVVGRTSKIIALAIVLTAFILLWMSGFAIWVFIPLLPAGIVFGIAISMLNRKKKKSDRPSSTDYRKAA